MADLRCPKCGVTNRDTARFCSGCGAPLQGMSPPAVSPSTPQSSPAQGQILQHRYRIEKELGRGGFGAVYRAYDLNLQRVCAVKENLDASQEAQRQFTREATTLANLSHPNLPRVTDHFFIAGKGQYLVMDFVEGEDLATLAEPPGRITVAQAAEWISQVADALIYMHGQSQPVLHRDIKPSNIRITPQGRAMLVDFGLVKFYAPNLKTTIGARAVTPGYAPPEQYGRGSTDIRSDIYALGATLYTLLTGEQPPESVQRLAGARMKPASQVNQAVPVHISHAVEKAMALDPAQRFASVSEFKTALQSARVQPQAAKPVTPAGQTSSFAATQQRSFPQSAVAARAPAIQSAPSVIPAAPVAGQRPVSLPSTPKARPGSTKLLWGIAVILALFLCILGTWGAASLVNNYQEYIASGDTATAEVQRTQIALARQRTQTAQAPKTLTAQAQLTRTAVAQTTQTARAQLTATSQAFEEAIRDNWPLFASMLGINQNRTLIYGPVSGSLLHEEDGYVEVKSADVIVYDFVAEVVFYNPYSSTRGAWDYGFLFRYFDDYNQARLIINSDSTWQLVNLTGSQSDYQFSPIEDGKIDNLNTSTGGSNRLLLICKGNKGWLYINYKFVASFDLSFRGTAGDVDIGTGINNGHEISGETTGYSDFSVWSLP